MTEPNNISRQPILIKETEARSIISPSRLPDTEYVINPYTGCSFACSYCYAAFMGRSVGHSRAEWGRYVYVKANAVDLFRKEIRGAKFSDGPSLFLSSVTDAWQGPERKYRLARGILEELVKIDYPGRVSILTKSPLITRDLDLLQRLNDVEVGVTITTEDDQLGATFEAQAPRNSDRLKTLQRLSSAGLKTYAFLGPLMAHHLDFVDDLEHLIADLKVAGVSFVYAELLNLNREIISRLEESMRVDQMAVDWTASNELNGSKRTMLAEVVSKLVAKYGLSLRLDKVIDHTSRPTKSVSPKTSSAGGEKANKDSTGAT